VAGFVAWSSPSAAVALVLPEVPAVVVGSDVRPEVPVGDGAAAALAADGVVVLAEGVLPADAEGVLLAEGVALAEGALLSEGEVLGEAADAALASGDDGDAVVEAGAADSLAVDAPPPAAFSNSIRCERSSTSFARMPGSTAVVPDVPTAPAVPGAPVAAAAGAADSSARCSPTSAVRFA